MHACIQRMIFLVWAGYRDDNVPYVLLQQVDNVSSGVTWLLPGTCWAGVTMGYIHACMHA